MSHDFKVGDFVYLPPFQFSGVIERSEPDHVLIRWDDGKSGLLYDDPRMVPYIGRLRHAKPIKLPAFLKEGTRQ